jgi:hypothetical protein
MLSRMPRRVLLLCLALAAPAAVRADLPGEPLAGPGLAPPPDLSLRPAALLLAADGADAGQDRKKPKPRPATASPGELDFDLLGEAEAPADAPDSGKMKLRRRMLTLHQGVGFGLLALQLGTTVVGQLNYRDKFATPANTEKWRLPHKVLAYAATGAFVLNGALALTAPAPVKRPLRLDRVMVHRIALFTAAAGMAAQVGLGIYTASREGYDDQRGLAKAHLYVGYGTLAAMLAGVGVLVF